MINPTSTFIKCECSSHALEVVNDPENSEYSIAIWNYGNYSQAPFSWKERLRWCWRIIYTGNPWADSVILNEAGKMKLISALNSNKELLLG